MTEKMDSNKAQYEETTGRAKPARKRSPIRIFAWFMLVLVLICGVFVLVTNGIYYWFSQPIADVYASAKSDLDGGLSADAELEADRLAHYQGAIDRLNTLPDQLAELDSQIWTFAVLIREDFHKNIPAMLDHAGRGKSAVAAYFESVSEIRDLVGDFTADGGRPPHTVNTLSAYADWYTARIDAADHLDELYNRLGSISDIELAGRRFSRSELGLDAVSDEVSLYRQPIADLKNLLDQSEKLESELDILYARNPAVADLDTTLSALDRMLLAQDEMTSSTANLAENLPEQIRPVLFAWSQGLPGRSDFVGALAGWWRNVSLSSQSLNSARLDRATAKRYLADSLDEPNVEIAYLWTRTAQAYQESMTTAINFANIYIDRVNTQIDEMNDSRSVYRQALGYPANQREIIKISLIDVDAFWLGD